jgi:undecaprenyl-diphosphatase
MKPAWVTVLWRVTMPIRNWIGPPLETTVTDPISRIFANRAARSVLVAIGLFVLVLAMVPAHHARATVAAADTAAVTPIEAPIDVSPAVAAPAAPAAEVTLGSVAAIDVVAAKKELTNVKAAVLGLVEGITEFLPVSSTGHLLVAERVLNVGQNNNTKEATDAYTVIIQLGAILAVLVVSWRRIQSIIMGLIGKSEEGRKLLIALICAIVPTAIIGLVLDKTAEKYLLKVPVVAAAWILGAVAIFLLQARYKNAQAGGKALELLTPKNAVVIGLVQTLAVALPGTSRSLVTILAAVVLGFSLSAAVEFSFLLGLATLSAAALLKIKTDGQLVLDTFGTTAPLIGLVVAAVAAGAAVKWMISYLNSHDLRLFGIYRIGAAVVTLALLAAGTI